MQRAVNPIRVSEERYEQLLGREREALDYIAATKAFRERTFALINSDEEETVDFVRGWTAAATAMATEIVKAMNDRGDR